MNGIPQWSFLNEEGRFRLDIGQIFFFIQCDEALHRLPIEVVDTPSLEVLKARLNSALGSLIWWEKCFLWQGVGTGCSFMSLPTEAILILTTSF